MGQIARAEEVRGKIKEKLKRRKLAWGKQKE